MAQTMDLITQLQVCAFNRCVSGSEMPEEPQFYSLLLHSHHTRMIWIIKLITIICICAKCSFKMI